MDLLYKAFLASMRGSSWKAEPQHFELDILNELTKLSDELTDRTYETSQRRAFITRERGKTRYIHSSRIRDRVVRHALCDNVITPTFQKYLIHNNGASQKGKGLSFAREQFERDLHNYWLEHRSNDGYIVILDFKKFYDNMRHDLIKEIADPKMDEFSAWLFDKIVDSFSVDVSYMTDLEYARCMDDIFDSIAYHKLDPKRTGEKLMRKSVEIGDQVSQNIGIFFPIRVDNYAKIVRGLKYYGRYMDDIYFLCQTPEEAHDIIRGITKSAEEIGLHINDRKTVIAKLSQTFTYLQIRYTLLPSGKVMKRINPKTVTRERRKLKAYKRLIGAGKISYEDVENAYKSWLGNFYKIMSKRQRKKSQRNYIKN